MSENEKQASVPYFVHEGTVTRMYRMFRLAVVVLAIALAVAVSALVINDTMWRHYCNDLEARYQVEDVANEGVYQQSDPGTD